MPLSWLQTKVFLVLCQPHNEGRYHQTWPPQIAKQDAYLPQVTDDSSQHSLIEHAETSCGAEGPDSSQGLLADELKVVDLRLKSETISRDSQSQVIDNPILLSIFYF